jgi:hypothetical protein
VDEELRKYLEAMEARLMTRDSQERLIERILEISRHIREAGYSDAEIKAGLAYACQQGPYTAREGYILAMSRILYSDGQLADGARFSVEAGFGPQ